MNTLKNLAYKFAGNRDEGRSIVRDVLAQYPSFHETIEKETRNEIYAGCQLRFKDNNPQREGFYILEHGAYFLKDEATWNKSKAVKIHLTVAYAMAESQQQFAQLRQRDKALYDLVKPLRDDVNKYSSNTIKTMQSVARDILNEGKSRERSATASFADVVVKAVDTLKARCKTAKARGDETALDKKLSDAITAFNKVWKA